MMIIRKRSQGQGPELRRRGERGKGKGEEGLWAM